MTDDLASLRADVAAQLLAGARDRRSALHTPAVATANADVRIMVLRAFDPESWTLRFHTDARSPKLAALAAEPEVGVLFYDPAAKLQLRCRGQGRAEAEGPIADAAWNSAGEYARRCYLAEAPPGSVLASPGSGLPQAFEGVRPNAAQLAPARPNFAVLLVALRVVDWLYLAHDGHRRAQFDVGGAGQWVVP